MKKILSIVLSAAVMLTMLVPSFVSAADGTYTVTISNAVKGHTYEAYQIFDGTLKVNGTVRTLGDVTFGTGVDSTKTASFLAEFKMTGDAGKIAVSSAKELAKAFAEGTLYKADGTTKVTAKEFARIASKYTSSVKTSGTSSITGLDAGYYLIKDATTPEDPTTDSVSAFITEVAADVTVTTKTGDVDIEKKVKDIADSNSGTKADWQDSADYDIGDDVPFKLTAHLPENFSAYDTYKLVFHDTQGAGLTFNASSVEVYVAGTKITSGYTVKTSGITSGETFNIVFDNMKTVSGAADSAEIRVEYTSKLNEDAVLGSTGNPNTVYLEYSNNPNLTENPTTAKTPTDKVKVFTYKLVVNKIDENSEALKGAGFTLYKKNSSGNYAAVGSEVKGANMTTFTWTGIDDGDYKLVETTVPSGYNTPTSDILFTVSASHDETSDDPSLTVLSGGDMFTGDVAAGTLTGTVQNEPGSVLPQTGGTGTSMLHILGIILLAGAGMIFMMRRKEER